MFLHRSGKRTGRSRRAPGARSFSQMKLRLESLESRRLLTGNNPWEGYFLPEDETVSPSDIISPSDLASLGEILSTYDISISALNDILSAYGTSSLGDLFSAYGLSSLDDIFSAYGISFVNEISSPDDLSAPEEVSFQEDLSESEEVAAQEEISASEEVASQEDLSAAEEVASQEEVSAAEEVASQEEVSVVDDFEEPPQNNYFADLTTSAEQQEVADSVAGGILAQLEALLSNQNPAPPELAPVPQPAPTWSGTVTNPIIDSFDIGWGVTPADTTDCAIDLSGSDDDPLVAIGFGEAVDEVTLAVNDYCSEKILDLADSLELVSGQIIACIWFDPINFSVSIGGNEVSYDYDNNPSAIVGSIPGASLVVTPAGQSTPGGVQVIMFAGNPASINVQMTTTNSGELMRGGVNIYTVSAGSNGPTVQPTIRTAFQGYLQRDTIVMSFDPSQPSFVRAGVAAGSVSVASLPAAARAVGGGAGGGLPIGIAGNFASPDLFAFAFLSPTALADSALDISGSTAVSEDQEGEVDGLEEEMLEQLGGDDLDARDEDEEDVSGEDRDGLDAGEFEEEEDLPDDEEELDEAISVLFNLIGESLASDSGHVDVLKILEDDRNEPQQTEESAASPRHQPWETEATEFLAKSMDRLNPESSARVEPTGQSRFFGT